MKQVDVLAVSIDEMRKAPNTIEWIATSLRDQGYHLENVTQAFALLGYEVVISNIEIRVLFLFKRKATLVTITDLSPVFRFLVKAHEWMSDPQNTEICNAAIAEIGIVVAELENQQKDRFAFVDWSNGKQ